MEEKKMKGLIDHNGDLIRFEPPAPGEDTLGGVSQEQVERWDSGGEETDPTVPAWAKEASKPEYSVEEILVEEFPDGPWMLSDYLDDIQYNIEYMSGMNPDEPIPTGKIWAQTDVGWANWVDKPTYTAEEVGALPDTTVIPTVPTNVSAFTNDANYVKNTDLAAVNKPGLISAGNWLTVNQTTGKMEAGELTKAQYDSADGKIFVGKTTLNNVIAGKANTSDLSAVATSGSYNDLNDIPESLTLEELRDIVEMIDSQASGELPLVYLDYQAAGAETFASIPAATFKDCRITGSMDVSNVTKSTCLYMGTNAQGFADYDGYVIYYNPTMNQTWAYILADDGVNKKSSYIDVPDKTNLTFDIYGEHIILCGTDTNAEVGWEMSRNRGRMSTSGATYKVTNHLGTNEDTAIIWNMRIANTATMALLDEEVDE